MYLHQQPLPASHTQHHTLSHHQPATHHLQNEVARYWELVVWTVLLRPCSSTCIQHHNYRSPSSAHAPQLSCCPGDPRVRLIDSGVEPSQHRSCPHNQCTAHTISAPPSQKKQSPNRHDERSFILRTRLQSILEEGTY